MEMEKPQNDELSEREKEWHDKRGFKNGCNPALFSFWCEHQQTAQKKGNVVLYNPMSIFLSSAN